MGLVYKKLTLLLGLYLYIGLWAQSAGAQDGFKVLSALARDAAGNTTISEPVVVLVQNTPPAPDAILPTVIITNRINGGIFSGNTLSVTVRVTDNIGVTRIDLYADGKLAEVMTATTSPLPTTNTLNWRTRGITKGEHIILIKVFDAAGNQAMASVTLIK